MAAQVLSGFALIINTCRITYKQCPVAGHERVLIEILPSLLCLSHISSAKGRTPFYCHAAWNWTHSHSCMSLHWLTANYKDIWKTDCNIDIKLSLSTKWAFSPSSHVQLDTLMATPKWARLHTHELAVTWDLCSQVEWRLSGPQWHLIMSCQGHFMQNQ